MRVLGVAAGLILLAGCAGGGGGEGRAPATPAAVAVSPGASGSTGPSSTTAPPPHGRWALPEGPRDGEATAPAPQKVATAAWSKASKVHGVAAAPASCAPFAKPARVAPAPKDLSLVLLEKDAVKRDAMLASVETTPERKWAILAMRGELAPSGCADVITDGALGSNPSVAGAAGQMTVGLSLAAKLSRTAAQAPAMKDATDKEKVRRFIQGPLREWMVQQASAIDALSAPAAELVGLARGVVAIEAGMADLRLVDRIRSAPTPSTWDAELKAVYEAALDEALEPRKARGRDAALVGLADFASAGIVQDARVDRARTLLSKLYGGRRIDALDALALPPKEAAAPAIPQTVLLLPDADEREAWHLPKSAPVRSARTRLDQGRTYWRRVDFVEAAHAAAKEEKPESRLVLALALALAKGPSHPKEMMSASSPAALGLTNTDALDELAADGSYPFAGLAAFDAAHLRSLSPPDGAQAQPWFTDLAVRFKKAATLLDDPALKARAEERAADAAAAAKAVKSPQNP